jgi:hypothetical protein
MAGLLRLAGLDDSFDAGPVTITPAMTARQARITRRFALGIFSLIITRNLTWASLPRTSALADPVDGVVAVTG